MKSTNSKQNKSKGSNKFLIIGALLLGAAAISLYLGNNKNERPAEEVSQNQNIAPVVSEGDLIINAGDVNEEARFYPYQAGDTYMEVLAVKASDGTVRTALNTCQVCFDSGQGYYKQEGNTVVCQNCGNVFGVDDIEKIKGGCNPVPVMSENKKVDGDNIAISEQFLNENKSYFADWKRD